MKYKVLEDLIGTKSLAYINDNQIVVKDSDNKLYLNGKYIDNGVEEFHSGIINGDLIYVKNEKSYIGSKVLEKMYIPQSSFKNYAIFSSEFNTKDFKSRYELIDIETLKVVHNFGIHHYKNVIKSTEGYCIFAYNSNLSLYNTISNEIHNLELNEILKNEELEIISILGVWKSNIIVATNKNSIVSLNISSPKDYFIWDEVKGLKIGTEYDEVIPSPENFSLDSSTGKLIGIFHKYYLQIDLESNKIQFKDMSNELKLNDLSTFGSRRVSCFNDSKIYQVAWFNNPKIDIQGVVVISRKALTIMDKLNLENYGFGTNQPIKYRNKLFLKILDNQVIEISEFENDY